MEGLLAQRGQPVPQAAPLHDLLVLAATSLEELEAAEAALEDDDVASALVKSFFSSFVITRVKEFYMFLCMQRIAAVVSLQMFY